MKAKVRILIALCMALILIVGITSTAFADQVSGDAVVRGDPQNGNITFNINEGEPWEVQLSVYISKQGSKHIQSFPYNGSILSSGSLDLPSSWQVNGYDLPYAMTVGKTENEAGTYNYSVTFQATSQLDVFSRDSVTTRITVNVKGPTSIDTTPPTISAPADVVAEAEGELTVVPIGNASASDDSGTTPTVTNNAPSAFPLGETTVMWTATDPSGNTATASQKVTVRDTTAPDFTFVPADITAEATDILTPVAIGLAAATDAFSVTITNNAPAGGFIYGVTTVTWTATDVHGNSSTATQKVTITDTTAPVFTLVPSDIEKEATDILTPVTLGSVTARDIFGVTVTNNAPDGFSYGDTIVTWTATDEHGNSSTATQKVTITDTTAPVFTYVPGPVTVILNGPVNLGQATAEDIFDVTVTNNAPATFPLGTTIVTWTATDEHGNVATATQSVTVKYNFIGILQPINMDGSSVFKAGSTVPVKFQLKDYYGAYVSNAVADISLNKYCNSILGDVVESASTSAATTGTRFRYDATANQYIFNLSTKGLASGTYLLTITLDDGTKQSVKISLK